MDDDDEFGDFGGFEAADPAFPVVDEIQPNLEAGPSPWAILDTASRNQVGMRPDLLCVENQFPPVLDPTVPTQQTNGEVPGSPRPVTPPPVFPPALDSPNAANAASLVNDILDGSFNRTSEPITQNSQPSDEVGVSHALDTQETNSIETPAFRSHTPQTGNGEEVSVTAEESSSFQPFQSHGKPATSDGNKGLGGGLNIVEVETPQKSDANIVVPPVLSLESEPKPAEKQLHLQQIQQESTDAVKSVVQEYKTLMQTSLQTHQESVNSLLQKNNKERQLQMELALTQQNKDVEATLHEMRQSLREEIERIAQESVQGFKDEMKEMLEKEKKQLKEEMLTSLEGEKNRISELVQEAVSAEQERGAQQLKEQKDQFIQLIEEERKETHTQTHKLLEEQRKQFQETLKQHLEEERQSHKESMDKVIEFANEEMRSYLKQERQKDRQRHQRQHASLDVFLNSARQQLTLMMEDDSDTMLPGYQQRDDKSSSSDDKDSPKQTYYVYS